MAKKTYVLVKCDVKPYDSSLKAPLTKLMTASISNLIEKKSRGKLTTKTKSKEGFLLTAKMTVTADDNAAPTKLDAKLALTVMSIGSTAKAFNGSSGGSTDGFGSKPKRAAGDLVVAVCEGFTPKVIATISKL